MIVSYVDECAFINAVKRLFSPGIVEVLCVCNTNIRQEAGKYEEVKKDFEIIWVELPLQYRSIENFPKMLERKHQIKY